MAGKTGTKIGLKEVAAQAGVSISAVSMALADSPQIGADTKQRVRAICRELGYPPKGRRAAAARRRRAGTDRLRVGFMIVGCSLQDEALSGMLHGLAVFAAKQQFRLEVGATEDGLDGPASMERVLDFARGLDGLIISGVISLADLDALGPLRDHTIVLGHLIGENDTLTPSAVACVATDNTAMGRMAAHYLTGRGHRRIGFFCERVYSGLYASRWLDGYRLGLVDAGIPLDDALVHVVGSPRIGGAPAADALSGLDDPPTAFICPDIRTAASFLERMQAIGRPVDQADIVLGGLRALAPIYGLEGCPLLSENPDLTAEVALDLVDRIISSTTSAPPSLTVPFCMVNFS